jgi:hypothetical protein
MDMYVCVYNISHMPLLLVPPAPSQHQLVRRVMQNNRRATTTHSELQMIKAEVRSALLRCVHAVCVRCYVCVCVCVCVCMYVCVLCLYAGCVRFYAVCARASALCVYASTPACAGVCIVPRSIILYAIHFVCVCVCTCGVLSATLIE